MDDVLVRPDCQAYVSSGRPTADTRKRRLMAMREFSSWLEGLGEGWRTVEWDRFVEYRGSENQFLGFGPIGSDLIADYLVHLERSGATPRARSDRLIYLRGYFRHLMASGTLLRDPTDGIRVPVPPKRTGPVLTSFEAEELLAALRIRSERDHCIASCLFLAGLRVGEVLSLRAEDILWKEHVIRLYDTKTRSFELRAAPDSALVALRSWLNSSERQSSRWVFPGHDPGCHLNSQAVRQAFHDAARRRGLDESLVTPRVARRTFASLLLRAGMASRDVSQALGHATPTIIRSYASTGSRLKLAKRSLRQSRLVHLWDTGEIRPL